MRRLLVSVVLLVLATAAVFPATCTIHLYGYVPQTLENSADMVEVTTSGSTISVVTR